MKVIEKIGKSVKVMGLAGIIWALASFGVAAPASAATISPSDSGSDPVILVNFGKLDLYAFDAVKGNVIGGAYVAVADEYGQVVAKGYTSSTGQFTASLNGGTYKVIISANGYKESRQYVQITSGEATTVKTALDASNRPTAR